VSYAVICGATPLVAAGIYSLEGFAGLFGRIIFGILADRFGPQKVIILGLAVQAAGIFAYGYATDVPMFFLIAPIVGLAYGGVMPLYAILAREYFSQRVMGTVLGAASTASFIGMGFRPVGGGWLYDTLGTYFWLYMASAAIGIAAAVMAIAFPRKSQVLPGTSA
jgi:MFS family permease